MSSITYKREADGRPSLETSGMCPEFHARVSSVYNAFRNLMTSETTHPESIMFYFAVTNNVPVLHVEAMPVEDWDVLGRLLDANLLFMTQPSEPALATPSVRRYAPSAEDREAPPLKRTKRLPPIDDDQKSHVSETSDEGSKMKLEFQ